MGEKVYKCPLPPRPTCQFLIQKENPESGSSGHKGQKCFLQTEAFGFVSGLEWADEGLFK